MTEQVKHTPGPWSVRRRGPHAYHVARVTQTEFGRETRFVADVCFAQPKIDGEQEANARLIAAAPDMLAALRAMLRVAEADLRLSLNPHPMRVAVVRDAKAAIAKATLVDHQSAGEASAATNEVGGPQPAQLGMEEGR